MPKENVRFYLRLLDEVRSGVCHATLTSDRKRKSDTSRTRENEGNNEQEPVHIHLRIMMVAGTNARRAGKFLPRQPRPIEWNLCRGCGFSFCNYKEEGSYDPFSAHECCGAVRYRDGRSGVGSSCGEMATASSMQPEPLVENVHLIATGTDVVTIHDGIFSGAPMCSPAIPIMVTVRDMATVQGMVTGPA